MKWLVTAFEPFAKAKTNSSLFVVQELAQLFAQRKENAFVDFYFPLRVTYKDAWPDLKQKLESTSYDGVLALGQAEGRSRICLERVAINWIDAKLPDNNGEVIQNQKIMEGPDVLWSPIPWEKWVMPVNCERSYGAGTFVCNHLMYQLLHWSKTHGCKAGFVHIPLVQGQGADFPEASLVTKSSVVQSLDLMLQFLQD